MTNHPRLRIKHKEQPGLTRKNSLVLLSQFPNYFFSLYLTFLKCVIAIDCNISFFILCFFFNVDHVFNSLIMQMYIKPQVKVEGDYIRTEKTEERVTF